MTHAHGSGTALDLRLIALTMEAREEEDLLHGTAKNAHQGSLHSPPGRLRICIDREIRLLLFADKGIYCGLGAFEADNRGECSAPGSISCPTGDIAVEQARWRVIPRFRLGVVAHPASPESPR